MDAERKHLLPGAVKRRWILVLLIGLPLAWLVGGVLIPVLRIGRAVRRYDAGLVGSPACAVSEWGGPDASARWLAVYLHLPKFLV